MEYKTTAKLVIQACDKDLPGVFGHGCVLLLQGIAREHSLNRAAKSMGMAYSKAWRIVNEAEGQLGCKLIERDGARGSSLTPAGERAIAAYEELQAGASPVTSARMRERVLAARAVQQARYAEVRYCRTNADLSGSLLEKHCRMGAPERAFLREAVQRLALSARAYTRILRISRTIADLAGSESIGVPHLAEAIGCRVLDREEF